MKIKKSIDVKLNVKPVFIAFYHDYVFEGPCRFGAGEELTKEYDLEDNKKAYMRFLENVNKYLAGEVNLLDTVFVDRNEEFQIRDELLEKIAQGSDKVDIYLFGQAGRGFDVIVEFAQRYRKAVMFSESPLHTLCPAASLIARGLETYPTYSWEDTVKKLKVLRVRKVLRDTKVLLAPRGNSNITFSTTDSFLSLEHVTDVFGVRFRYINMHELLDQTRHIDPNNNHTIPGRAGLNPTDEDMKTIGDITDKVIADADSCGMEREDVFNSVKHYYTVRKMLAHYECSAFSTTCPDACATRRLNEEKITFCLTHSLLNEEGIASACEYDIPALLSMIILMNFSNSAPYMGNTAPAILKDGKMTNLLNLSARFFRAKESREIDIPALGDAENVICTFHAVPNRKLKGFDRKPACYGITSFTRGSNFGATIRYDFKKDAGQTITMCRFDLTCKRLFVARGTIVGGVGYTDKNCSEGVFFTVENDRDFFIKQTAFGNHVPLVYGDYLDDVVELGKILGLELVTA